MITLGFADRADLDRLIAALLIGAGLYPEPSDEELTEWQTLARALGDALDTLPEDLPTPDPADPPGPPRVAINRPTGDVEAFLAAAQDIDEPQIRAAAVAFAEVYRPWKQRERGS